MANGVGSLDCKVKAEVNNHTENSNDDDPVIKEIPVFVSQRLKDQLYVFQYPLCPKASKDSLNVNKCFIKPQNQSVKLEVQLNTSSQNFDIGKAEEIAQRVDGPSEYRKNDKDLYFENNIFDKVTYLSSKSVDDPQNYAVGVYNGKEFHITPLKGILRLKPYHPHLDKDNKKKQECKKEPNEEEAGPSKAQQVTVKFSSRNNINNVNAKKPPTLSYKRIMEKNDEESWIECDWHYEGSELCELEKSKLYAEDTNQITPMKESKNYDPYEYITRLVPEDKEQAIIRPSLPSNVVSYSLLKTLPLLELCKLLLKEAKVISFQQLSLQLAGCEGFTTENLLKTLPQVAVLVRGNWIVKSEILFPNNTFSDVSGVPAELMCRARDYILIRFAKNLYVERHKVSSVIKIPTEEIKEILMGVSTLSNYNKYWELTLPTDMEFINKYPDVVNRQNLMWEQRELQLTEFFKEAGKEKKQRRKSKSVSEDPSRCVKRENQVSSDQDSGTENKSSSKKSKISKL